MIREVISELESSINKDKVSIENRIARIQFSDKTRVILEYESNCMHSVKLYGTDMCAICEGFKVYEEYKGSYRNIPVDSLLNLFDSASNHIAGYAILVC